MKKPIYLNFQFIKVIWILLLIAGFSGAVITTTFTVDQTNNVQVSTRTAGSLDTTFNSTGIVLRRRVLKAVVMPLDLIGVLLKLFPSPKL